ncbi:MAG: glycosyltransferase family 2 protein [Candidatus Wallbacteria bacterium]|nr:glycosyltransferase family 2 protein [Candidatus Wallbacteria bacterium]
MSASDPGLPSSWNTGPGRVQLSVVVVHHRNRERLRACLDSLAAQTFRDFELVLVANGVEPPGLSQEDVPSGFETRHLALPVNLGFAGGANAGIRSARGNLIALLNDDAVAEPDWAARLVEAARTTPWAACFASRVLRAPDGARIDSAGDLFTWFGEGFSRGAGEPDGPAFASDCEVFGPSAAAALYRRDFFVRTGLFDESFFFSYEDVDLAVRARLLGLACLYVSGARVLHSGGATRGPGSVASVFHQSRNVEWVFWGNLPLDVLVRALPWHLARSAWGLFVAAYRAQLGPYVLGKLAAVRGLPRLLHQRSHRLASARISGWALASMIDPRFHYRRLGLLLSRLVGRTS